VKKSARIVANVLLGACVLGATACDEPIDQPKGNCTTRQAEAATKAASTQQTGPIVPDIELVELDIGVGADAVTRATPGNPKGVKPPHLRAKGKREEFKVRPGMANLALFKDITASEKDPIRGDLDQITDGLKLSDEFDYVELAPELGWVQIDLEQPRAIHAVVIWHFYKNATIYNDVIVRVADDAAFTTNVRTLFNNDHDNSAKMGKGGDKAFYTRWWGEIVDARGANYDGTTARYVRVYTGAGMEDEPPRFVEIEVYGK